jgi:HAD superfamily phosphatase
MIMKAVIFDMDGVLVDVSRSYRLAIKKTVQYFLGEKIRFSKIQEYKNRGGFNNDWDLTRRILKDYGKKIENKTVIRAFQGFYLGENYNGLIKNEKWLLAVKILEDIKKIFKLGIVTGRPRKEACYALERFGREAYFPVLVTMDDVPPERAKPDPFGIRLALKRLGTQDAFYVGDTVDDMKAARRARITPIGVVGDSAGYERQRDLLLSSGARWVLKDINDILEVLG